MRKFDYSFLDNGLVPAKLLFTKVLQKLIFNSGEALKS